jgi:hypothetical protein
VTAKWEVIVERRNEHDVPVDRTERLKVPGGWLYRVIRDDMAVDDSRDAVALVFVPDAEAMR